MNNFSSNLKAIRKIKGLTQQQLADGVGLGRSAIANYEQGFSNPEYDKLIAIANYLDITIDGFLTKDLTVEYQITGEDEKRKIVFPKGKNMLSNEESPPSTESDVEIQERLDRLTKELEELRKEILHNRKNKR